MAATTGARFDGSELNRRAAVDEYTAADPATEARVAMYERDRAKRESARASVETLAWIVAAMAVLYYFDVVNTLRTDPRVLWNWLMLGVVAFSVFGAIGAYFGIYLAYVVKKTDDMAESSAIPVAVVFLLIGATAMTIAVWPVWGFVTPVIGFVEFMGFVMITSFLP
ncbi:uncharacterized protein AMSG_02088 [Thecamonas trahens ATCC 50062]|uniref:Transmembrane protein 128 n=1 Tax=Thecamonas trahens ATCC 50062 TaxID=461836 RepID=A0A0L0DVI5_THETB|nr:hypothetical protein AMSG_02088 [Thecamonas trahens ATCC 50062]KNC56076.1 hypothetical protein AMSG_02088 [Thecamonas trahens ATCC 50062]|eukprot:XP_013761120.1 hypothetical protein AMSG_02088 [Thecamonas trahens ATCC 50062]